MIKVLIVDDSTSILAYLSEIFASDPEIVVAGTARNGNDALSLAMQLRPDIISMDINMPDMDGFAATRAIMSTCPTPIVIVSSLYDKSAVAMSFRSLEVGALAILPKPPAMNSPDFPVRRQELLDTFKTMAGVKVIRRNFAPPPLPKITAPVATDKDIRIIAVGASTGGPQVIQEILGNLSPSINVPILIVQHITPGFEYGFAVWLDQSTGFNVSVAVAGEMVKGGHVYIAPNSVHMEVSREGRIVLVAGPLEHGVCPSVSRFFRSVVTSYRSAALGIILTGMGRDGGEELKLLRDAGGMTIVQDRDSSIVNGMPGEAIRLGGACYVLPANAIAAMINTLLQAATVKTRAII